MLNRHDFSHLLRITRRLQKIKVIGLRRDNATIENPESDTELGAGDVLVVEGHPDDIQAAEIEIMSGR